MVKIDDDLHDLRSMEAEFPATVIDDAFAPQDAVLCKSRVSTPVNDDIKFRISFDESDDEDYVIIYDKNSFSYKMIYVNNLKTDLENDNEKADIPSFQPPKPMTSYVDDVDLFKDFENEFPAIVYNDAQMSKSNLLTELILNPQHIDKFDLNNETSLSEYDEEEQNVLYFNDLFPFNIIRPADLKSEKDNDDNYIDIIQSSEGNKITHGSNKLFETSHDKITKSFRTGSFVMNLKVKIVIWKYYVNGMLFFLIMNLYVPFGLLFDPKLYYKDGDCAIMLRRPRYQGLEYTDADIANFEERMVMEHRDDAGVVVLLDLDAPDTIQFQLGRARRRLSWRQFIMALGLHTGEEMESPSFARYWSESYRIIPVKGDLHDYQRGISTDGDFLGPPPSYTLIRDPMLRLCHRMMAHSIAGRKSRAHISGGQFVGRLAQHFGLLTAEILRGLTICEQLDDTWAWVAIGPERQPDVAASAATIAEDAPVVDKGDQAILAPVQAPQQPPPPPPAAARTMP
ncbi:hypothetical protein Tco_0933199 [Tanacetum coccineum]